MKSPTHHFRCAPRSSYLGVRLPDDLRAAILASVRANFPETISQFLLRAAIRELRARTAEHPSSPPA